MAFRNERFRFWAPIWLLAGFATYVAVKLVCAHLFPEVDDNRYVFERQVPAARGAIYDAMSRPLVKAIPFWDYHLDPVALTGTVVKVGKHRRTKEEILHSISSALDFDYGKLVKMSEIVTNRYQSLGMSANQDVHRQLSSSTNVAGVAIRERHVREYLRRRSHCHVLGAVNASFAGCAGIEQRFNGMLTGIPGMIRGYKDAYGHEIYDKRVVTIDPTPGNDVYLTVDATLQNEAEIALADGVGEFGAGSGWCIVMDARSAAVLAMASLPDFSPPAFRRVNKNAQLNRVIGFTYEPGSVMKVITAASAFDAQFVSPGRMYSTARNDERYYRLPGDGSHKWEPYMSIRDAIVHSSNIVIGKLGYDFGQERLLDYMKAFGFGSKTGIELPGEEVGILHSLSDMKKDRASWSRVPIGQAVTVTAIQLASAYQAIANDGVRMQPHIVSKIVNAQGGIVYEYRDCELGRPISKNASQQIREVMLGVASKDGTARRAAIRGYSVAGKTGTAQKVIPGTRGYAPGLYRATFIGIVPANEPRLVTLVTLDFDSNTKFHQGGNSSAVVFRRLTKIALRYLQVLPDKPEELEDEDPEDEVDDMLDRRASVGMAQLGQACRPNGLKAE